MELDAAVAGGFGPAELGGGPFDGGFGFRRDVEGLVEAGGGLADLGVLLVGRQPVPRGALAGGAADDGPRQRKGQRASAAGPGAAVRARCTVPLVASGGAGVPHHFADVFREADVDAALAASVFHSGDIAIPELKRYLAAAGITVHLAEPADTAAARGRKRHAKTDKTDSRHLRTLLADGRLPECWIPPAQILECRALLETYHDLRAERTAWVQRIHAVFFHQGAPRLGEAALRTEHGAAALREAAAARLSPAGPLRVALRGAQVRYEPDGPLAIDGVDLDLAAGRHGPPDRPRRSSQVAKNAPPNPSASGRWTSTSWRCSTHTAITRHGFQRPTKRATGSSGPRSAPTATRAIASAAATASSSSSEILAKMNSTIAMVLSPPSQPSRPPGNRVRTPSSPHRAVSIQGTSDLPTSDQRPGLNGQPRLTTNRRPADRNAVALG